MIGSGLETVGALLAVVGPLVAVPVTMITFYLRGLREHQRTGHAEVLRRLAAVETSLNHVRRAVDQFERDYATKEEWVRECVHARRGLELLTRTVARWDERWRGLTAGFAVPRMRSSRRRRASGRRRASV